jgi:hypothetical protein
MHHLPTLKKCCALHLLFVLATLEGWDFLSLDTAKFHLLLELTSVANAREEVGLATTIAVKGSKPLVPLLLKKKKRK